MRSNAVPAPPHPLRDRTSEGSDYPRKSEESIYFSSTTSAGVGALEAPPAIPFFSGSSSRLSTESRPRRRRSGSGSMIVMAAGDPGLYLRPPVIGDTKLEHDRARRLGVANDLEAVIAVSGELFAPGLSIAACGVSAGGRAWAGVGGGSWRRWIMTACACGGRRGSRTGCVRVLLVLQR